MLRTGWPNIYQTKDKRYWVVDSRRYHAGERTGSREYFDTEAIAKGRADELKFDVVKHGHNNGTIPLDVRADAVRAEEMLKPYNKTVLEAARFFIAHHKEIEERSKHTVGKAVDLFLKHKEEVKESGKFSEASLKTAKKRIKHLKTAFADRTLYSLTVADFEGWLKTAHYSPKNKKDEKRYFNPRTMKGVKSISSEFFKWCIKQGWIQANPAQFMRISQDLQEAKILTPEQSEKLLNAANTSPFRDRAYPYVLLGLFAGLRPSEAEDLHYKDIHFETLEIRVASRKLRGQVRYVPINKELATILKFLKWDGSLKAENWRKQFDSIKLMAGFNADNPFPVDGLRHSFASYWLVIHNDRPRLAEIMGNSVEIIRNHYRKAIPRAVAETFWALLSKL